eukprot:358634-Chlamydomonas_euryale.AAC.1
MERERGKRDGRSGLCNGEKIGWALKGRGCSDMTFCPVDLRTQYDALTFLNKTAVNACNRREGGRCEVRIREVGQQEPFYEPRYEPF